MGRHFGAAPSDPAPFSLGASRAPLLHRWAFVLLLLATACFFIRPTEILDLQGWNLYEYLIGACCLISLPRLLTQFSWRTVMTCPITACVLCIAALVAASIGSWEQGLDHAIAFAKVVLYLGLLLAVVDTPPRLKNFVVWVAFFIFVLGLLPVLQYHHAINVASLTPIEEEGWAAGSPIRVLRLVGAGTFNDPNDLCLILSIGLVLGAYAYGMGRGAWWRLAWLAIGGLNLYAIVLTESRGGLIALLAGAITLLAHKIGWRKTTVLTALLIPLLLLAFQTRQTDLGTSSGTAQLRVQLWGSAMMLFTQHPLLGIGAGNLPGAMHQVAHNSFLQCYAELGWLGGTAFLGAFAIALNYLRAGRSQAVDPQLQRLRPYLLAALVAYVAGMLSLTHSYEIAVYLMLGLAIAWHRLASPRWNLRPWPSLRFVIAITSLSLGFLVACHLFIRLTFRN